MWKLPRWFWARSAGVPVAGVLASEDAAAAAGEVLRLERESASVDAELHAACVGLGAHVERRRFARRLLRQLRRGRDLEPVDGLATLETTRRRLRAERTAALASARATIAHARDREQRALWQIIADPRTQTAAALTSRSLAGAFARALERGPGREIERRALLFVQRLTAKPAMLSEFGPCWWGTLAADQPAALEVNVGDRIVRERRVWFEHWAIHALARRIQTEPEIAAGLVVRLNPGCLLEGNTLYYPVGHRLRLEPLEAEVVRWCTEGHTRAELDAKIAARPERDQLATLLANHLKSGVATCEIEIPTVEPHPERRLRAALADLPAAAPWLAALDELDELRRGLETARSRRVEQALDDRFHALTGVAPTRNPGVVHGARFVTYEDTSRDIDVTLGAPLARDLAALDPVFDLASAVVRECAARFEHKLLPIHARLARNLNAVDFVMFIRETQWIHDSAEVVDGVIRDLRDAWRARLGDRLDGDAPLELSPDDVREVASAFAGSDAHWLPAADCHAVCAHVVAASADAFAAGAYRLVLDKLYKGVPMQVHPAALPFCPDRDGVVREFSRWLGRPLVQLVDLPRSYHRSNLNLPDCAELRECALPGGPSRCPPERVVPCSELEVVDADGHLHVRSHDGSVDTPLFAIRWPFLQRKLIDVVLHPIDRDRVRSPRVTMGPWIVARAQWRFSASELRWRGVDPMIEIRRWQAAHQIPDHVFVKTPAQPKSVALDLRSVLHAELLQRLVARTDGELRVTEMVPDPSQCWLADASGRTYVCELRFTAFKEA